jgi:HSP20 family protein
MTNPAMIRQMRAMMDRAFFPWNLIAASDYTASVENLPLDVYNDNGNLVIKAALPGLKPENVNIAITNGVVDIHAGPAVDKDVRETDYYLREYATQAWHRSLRLPENVNEDLATASYSNGFLTLSIPRVQASAPRTIEVKVG